MFVDWDWNWNILGILPTVYYGKSSRREASAEYEVRRQLHSVRSVIPQERRSADLAMFLQSRGWQK